MEFTFDLDHVGDCITGTESELREFAATVLSGRRGADWENQDGVGWTPGERQDLAARREDERTRFRTREVSERLLHYTHLVELKALILRNWQDFSGPLGSKERVEGYLDRLNDLRIPTMHGRPLSAHEKHLALGICGELLEAVDRWRGGFNFSVARYEVDFQFCLECPDRDHPLMDESETQARDWLQGLCGQLGVAPEDLGSETGKDQSFRLRLPNGHVVAVLRWGHEAFDGNGYYTCANASLRSASEPAFYSSIKASGSSYWVLGWTLREELDLSHIVANAKSQAGREPTGSSTVRIGGGASILTGATFPLTTIDGNRIRADLFRSWDETGGRISLVLDGPLDRSGFLKAHKELSPNWVLTAVSGIRSPVEIAGDLRAACQP